MSGVTLVPQRNLNFINLKDYGCAIDGVTDDSVPFTAAYQAAASLGMGLFHPGGTLIKGNDALQNMVPIVGSSRDGAIIKLKNGANTDLFSANTSFIDITASFGTGNNGGAYRWGFSNLTLDGNRANQSSGPSWCLRAYGYNFVISNVLMTGGYSGGWQNDWHGSQGDTGTDIKAAQISGLECLNSGGIGLEFGGPHDTQFTQLGVGFHNVHCLHVCPNAGGTQFAGGHVWSAQNNGAITGGGIPLLVEANNIYFSNFEAEGAHGAFPQLVFLGTQNGWAAGRIFSDTTLLGSGMQIGQAAGNVPYQGMVYQGAGVTLAIPTNACNVSTVIDNCVGSNGGLWLANDTGNTFVLDVSQTSGNYITGTLSSKTSMVLNGHGLTADGTIGKGGLVRHGVNSQQSFRVTNGTNDLVNVDGFDTQPRFELPNGIIFKMYSDAYSTQKVKFDQFGNITIAGNIIAGQSATAPAVGNNGTIATSGISEARIAPTGNVTGIILAAGSAGQHVSVVNESNFSATFDVSGTSHVLGGVSNVLAPDSACLYVYDGGISLWVPHTPAPQPPLILTSEILMSGGGSAVMAANTVYCYLYVLQTTVTATGMRWMTGATAAGNVDAGIYDSGGNLLAHTGSTANTVANTCTNVAFSGGNIVLAPGRYYIAMSPGNSTDTFERVSGLITAGSPMIPIYTATNGSTGTTSPVLQNTTGGVSLSGKCPFMAVAIVGGI